METVFQNPTLPHIAYPDERYDQFVVATGVAQGLQGRCLNIIYHEIEFPEDEALVSAWSKRFGEIFRDIRISDDMSMQRAQQLKPLLSTLTLDYILTHPDGWKQL
ncbi:MAG: hypothetical protein LBE13_00805 [Bacteroidales bacterium]|jgi:hypothetical protein|nr:hypothetical protein [Bacteroidales bacterium]